MYMREAFKVEQKLDFFSLWKKAKKILNEDFQARQDTKLPSVKMITNDNFCGKALTKKDFQFQDNIL